MKTTKWQTDFLEQDIPSEYNVNDEVKDVIEQQAVLQKEIDGGIRDMLPTQSSRATEWVSRVNLACKAFMKTNI